MHINYIAQTSGNEAYCHYLLYKRGLQTKCPSANDGVGVSAMPPVTLDAVSLMLLF